MIANKFAGNMFKSVGGALMGLGVVLLVSKLLPTPKKIVELEIVDDVLPNGAS